MIRPMSAPPVAAAADPNSLLKTSKLSLTCVHTGGRALPLPPSSALFTSTYEFQKKLFIEPSIRKASCRCSLAKKSRRDKRRRESAKLPIDEGSLGTSSLVSDNTSPEIETTALDSLVSVNDSRAGDTVPTSPRSTVLRACTLTSGALASLGLMIREGSRFASTGGLPVVDCTTQVSFGFETWHLELITGLVVLISSFRYLLLKSWPDFSESSEAANRQVLTSLEPLDYLVVAFLPGVSEEILFRGALLPIFGMNWASVVAVATLFGVLHLGNGRNYSFAIWATFVGLAYGYATVISSSMWVPILSHSLNNLAGGILWRLNLEPSSK